MNHSDLYDRVLGSLATACIGDALGAPAEQRSPSEIEQLWGGWLHEFRAPRLTLRMPAGARLGRSPTTPVR